MSKIYWQHPESDSCGWVETERMAEILSTQPCVDTYISEELYDQRVAQGFTVCPPTENWLLDEKDRQALWDHYQQLKTKLDTLGAIVQNDGVCMKTNAAEMNLLAENISDGVRGFVNFAHRVPKRFT